MKHIEQNYLAQKDISEAHRAKLSSSKDISEAHRVFYQILIHVWLSQKGVYNKDDRGTLTNKETNNTRRSKQNTYHVGE